MEKIRKKILNNFEKDILNELKTLSKKGFVLNENNLIYCYSINNIFYKYDWYNFIDLISSKIDNFYNISIETMINIINNVLVNDKPFNIISDKEMEQFNYYCIAKEYLNQETNQIGKRTINNYIKENEQLKNNDFTFNLNDIQSQNQLLINNDIFKDSNNNLWIYNKDNNLFERVTNSDIEKLYYNACYNELKTNEKEPNEIKTIIQNTIITNKKYNNYNQLVYIGNAPNLWNEQSHYLNMIEQNKNSYKIVKNVIKSFE